MSAIQLQIALANELTELIRITLQAEPPEEFWWIEKLSPPLFTQGKVTPREWDWIVWECEKKLLGPFNRHNRSFYKQELHKLTKGSPLFASWQQRAMAYFKTIGKEIV